MLFIRLTIIVLMLFTTALARADGPSAWTLTTADFNDQTVLPVSMDDHALTIRTQPNDLPRTLPLTQLLELHRPSFPPANPAGHFVLHLLSGDQLIGDPGQTHQEQLTWRSPTLGELTISLRQIVAIIRIGQPSPILADSRPEDIVQLANGDTLHGILTAISPGQLTLQPATGDPAAVPLDSVIRITFAATAQPKSSSAPAFRLRFTDGSSLVVPAVHLANERVQVKLSDNATRDIPLQSITAIEQLNGPVVWLSKITPKENIQIPFLSVTHPAQMDRNVLGQPIRFDDHTFTHGIGVHSYSKLVYTLDGQFAAFRTQYAIDTTDSDGRYADVTVRIFLDDRVVHEQVHFKAGALAPAVQVPIKGAHTLTLEVDYGQTMDVQDRFNWIEPALLRQLTPATQPAPP